MERDRLDWDKLRVFLALCRHGSITKTQVHLGIGRTTLWRALKGLSEEIDAKLFDVGRQGISLTRAGRDLEEVAIEVEAAVLKAQRKISGHDQSMEGDLVVTLPEIMTTDLLMPAIADFAELHKEISLQISSTHRPLDLQARQADVAIRVSQNPPEDLVGRKVLSGAVCEYASHEYVAKIGDAGSDSSVTWIGLDLFDDGAGWRQNTPYADAPVRHGSPTSFTHLAMLKAGMGAALLPCFYGDTCAELARLPGSKARIAFDIWVLFHPDVGHTAKVRAFAKHMTTALKALTPVIKGQAR